MKQAHLDRGENFHEPRKSLKMLTLDDLKVKTNIKKLVGIFNLKPK